jgi:hypothetical protein
VFVLLGEGSFDSNVSVSGLSADAPQRINLPYNSTTSQSRLDNKHVAVCDMVQTPVDQLAVERNSVHAEGRTVADGRLEVGGESLWVEDISDPYNTEESNSNVKEESVFSILIPSDGSLRSILRQRIRHHLGILHKSGGRSTVRADGTREKRIHISMPACGGDLGRVGNANAATQSPFAWKKREVVHRGSSITTSRL